VETKLAERAGMDPSPFRDSLRHVIALLDAAIGQIQPDEESVQRAIRRASSLLREQIHLQLSEEVQNERAGLLTWQARKLCDYIDSHIAERLFVTDLSAIVQLSAAHFSRLFKLTFDDSPHAFVLRRRVALAARYMLQTDESLSDIAFRCGFADQAHFSRSFRRAMAQSPAAWRRGRGRLGGKREAVISCHQGTRSVPRLRAS
jgi:AraC family transcriptional regulator